jgi:hypothetical protein
MGKMDTLIRIADGPHKGHYAERKGLYLTKEVDVGVWAPMEFAHYDLKDRR